MTANEYAYAIQGFRAIAKASNHIQGFIHGDTDRLLNALRSKINYPVLVLDFPTSITINQNSEVKQSSKITASFAVLNNAAKDDFKRQNDIMIELFEHIKQIVFLMQFGYNDSNNDPQRFFPNAIISVAELIPVAGYTSDNLFGWAAECNITLNSCLPSEWTSNFTTPCPPSNLHFTWDTDGTTITCEADASLTIYNWYYRNELTNVYETANDADLVIPHQTGNSTIVVLEYEDEDGCTYWQTVSIPKSTGLDMTGISHPTIFIVGAQLNEDFWQ